MVISNPFARTQSHRSYVQDAIILLIFTSTMLETRRLPLHQPLFANIAGIIHSHLPRFNDTKSSRGRSVKESDVGMSIGNGANKLRGTPGRLMK